MLGMQAGGVKVRGAGLGRVEGGSEGGRKGVGRAKQTLKPQHVRVCAIWGEFWSFSERVGVQSYGTF